MRHLETPEHKEMKEIYLIFEKYNEDVYVSNVSNVLRAENLLSLQILGGF